MGNPAFVFTNDVKDFLLLFWKSGGATIPVTKYEAQIAVPLTKDYASLVAQIDEMARDCEVSRSAIIRGVLCDFFEFTPENAMNLNKSTRFARDAKETK
jgi:hypothetical protein